MKGKSAKRGRKQQFLEQVEEAEAQAAAKAAAPAASPGEGPAEGPSATPPPAAVEPQRKKSKVDEAPRSPSPPPEGPQPQPTQQQEEHITSGLSDDATQTEDKKGKSKNYNAGYPFTDQQVDEMIDW